MQQTIDFVRSGDFTNVTEHLVNGNALKKEISETRHKRETRIGNEADQIRPAILYLNMLQEAQELISNTRHLLRGANRFQTGKSSGDMWEMPAR